MAAEHKAIEDRDQAITASNRAQAESDATRAAYEAIGRSSTRRKSSMPRSTQPRAMWPTGKSFLAGKTSERDASAHALAEVEAALESARVQHENDLRWLAEHQAVEALSVRIEDVAKDLSERLKLEHEMASTHQQAEHFDRAVNAAQTSLLDKETALATLQSQERELDEENCCFQADLRGHRCASD